MSTPTLYSEIYGFVRTILGDTDTQCLMYSDDALNGHVDFMIVQLSKLGLEADQEADPPQFTSTLTATQKMQVTINIALNIIRPQPLEFSYNTPVISVRRKVDLTGFYMHLRDMLDSINGGKFAISVDTDVDAIIWGARRMYDTIMQAFEKGPITS